MTSTIFREYDIRGIFEKELNEYSVKLIGYFLGCKIGGKKVVTIGYDAREHSPILRDYLTSGLNKAGCTVLDIGLVPTPVSYFSNYIYPDSIKEINASIMITGSHNPKEYNGFKITIDKKPFFGSDIYALKDEILQHLDMQIEDNLKRSEVDIKSLYIDYLVDDFKDLKSFDKKVVLDCGNGVAGVVIKDIFDRLNLNYKGLYCKPDGTFPNHHPDPSVEENLADIKQELANFDLGFAYDGDADRIAVLTKKRSIKGDELAILYAKNMQNPIVIGEVKCSKVMYDELEKMGATPIMYKTGHSNLKVKIKELNAKLACEVSGHIFFNDRYFGFDDAIYATLRVIELVKNGMDLDKEIEALPKLYSTDELKVKTTDEAKFKIIDKIKELLQNPPSTLPQIVDIIDIDGLRINFENGWALVRASNTTPILVTRFEVTNKDDLELYQNEIAKLITMAKDRS